MLPPQQHEQNQQNYTHGTLTLTPTQIHTQLPLQRLEVLFFGAEAPEVHPIRNSQCPAFKYNIMTNLWHFYSYLHDARTIPLTIYHQQQSFNVQYQIYLQPAEQVLNPHQIQINRYFNTNAYLLNNKQICPILDQQLKQVGTIELELSLQFDEVINRLLFEQKLIDFQEMLVIDQISPISSTISYNMPQPQPQLHPKQIQPQSHPHHPYPTNQQPHRSHQHEEKRFLMSTEDGFENVASLLLNKQPVEGDDQKMMQEDIDRMIAQMNSKPYDSSKYLQTSQDQQKKQNYNLQNMRRQHSQHTSKAKQRTISIDPFLRTEKIESKGTISSYKQIPPPFLNTQFPTTQPNMSYHSNFKRPFYTQELPSYNSSPAHRHQKWQKSNTTKIINQYRNGLIRLKIHELTMQKLQKELGLLLKVYLNDDSSQFYSVSGLRQGEIISFSSSIVIDQNPSVDYLRFQLIDTYDLKSIVGSAIFEMSRLFSQHSAKGMFMINLPPQANTANPKSLRVEEGQLIKITPNIKNLRIEMAYEQRIDIVQIYLCLSDFDQICRKCSYKIPMTKETISFRTSELLHHHHINIFPHNRTSSNSSAEKIILEMWGQNQLIGYHQISLKPIATTNQKIISSSLHPIHLYDQQRHVNDLLSNKRKGKFHLKLCYGSIGQIQGLLNVEKRREIGALKPVAVEDHLGIYLKENKSQKQVQIQVDQEIFPTLNNISKKISMHLQQQELPQDHQDNQEQQDHLDPLDHQQQFNLNSSKNEFITESLEYKYLQDKYKDKDKLEKLNKAVVGKVKEQQVLEETNLSKSQKAKVDLDSLTRDLQQKIKDVLIDFTNESIFNSLKKECQGSLLYNFIEAEKLVTILQSLGIKQQRIDWLLLQILPVSNSMINVNILYDMIFGLILDQEVKQKYMDDYQMGKFFLRTLYTTLAQYHPQNLTFDQNIQFEEAKQIYRQGLYNITMREFNLIQKYLQKQIKDNPQTNCNSIKMKLIEDSSLKQKQQESIQQYEKEVISKIYKNEWDEEDDFFISNINQNNSQNNSQNTSLHINQNSNLNTNVKTNQNISLTANYSQIPNPQHLKHMNENKQVVNERSKGLMTLNSGSLLQQERTGHSSNYRLVIEGFEQCIQTIECLLNTPLSMPQINISYHPSHPPLSVIRNQYTQSYSLDIFIQGDVLQGRLELQSNGCVIARCNLSMMALMKSCYSLKSVATMQFCGIVKLILEPIGL